MLENASFVHVFGCMCMLELTITGWWIIVAYLSIPNWFELQLVSQLASYLFSYFLLRSLLPFSNSKFFLISCDYLKLTIKIHKPKFEVIILIPDMMFSLLFNSEAKRYL